MAAEKCFDICLPKNCFDIWLPKSCFFVKGTDSSVPQKPRNQLGFSP
jgi:hypothetical protein